MLYKQDITFGEFRRIIELRLKEEFKIPWHMKIYYFFNRRAKVKINYGLKNQIINEYLKYFGLANKYSFSTPVLKNYYETEFTGNYNDWFKFSLMINYRSAIEHKKFILDCDFLDDYPLYGLQTDYTQFECYDRHKFKRYFYPYPKILFLKSIELLNIFDDIPAYNTIWCNGNPIPILIKDIIYDSIENVNMIDEI